ncbi:MAG: thioredoxin-disulfide reductase [Methanobrevibacter sp.]|uniref:thioredoxin-disulfide reductase n=1 Tax=Methanobrevibacter sp. TaxID=66852 RepID=UPI00257C215A|nr:thioredoxin-disulfide reductase [Methanobrevibacter sp.]MBR2665883.1 thioredoxin-disulfide reductase [Methanobrevibacter sp.]MBR3197427.1 thioredoxin-disulfide reductase [Methanobrevibacter sp.]MBR7049998.1 thioredoxin-disulfide reductase [Methanobrevibacter sp.]
MEKYDIIIIGAGPGGLTAGIYAGRQGTRNLIIDRDLAGGLGREVPEMENYPGFDNVSGLELIEKMKAQAIRNCDLHEMEEVTEIIKSDDDEYHFTVKTAKDEYKTKTVILATGSSHRHLNAKGEEEFKGKGVSYCATCDGFFFQGRDIVMVGGGNSALQEALYLNNLGAKVTLIHRRDEFRAQKHLQDQIKEAGISTILNATVEEIKGEMLVESVVLKDTQTGELSEHPTSGVFISVGYIPHTELAKQLGVELDESGHIIIDTDQKTNVDYVYAIGDVCVGLKQWVVACGEGAVAATSAYHDLS